MLIWILKLKQQTLLSFSFKEQNFQIKTLKIIANVKSYPKKKKLFWFQNQIKHQIKLKKFPFEKFLHPLSKKKKYFKSL